MMISEKAEVTVGPAAAQWVTLHVQVPHESGRQVGPGAHPMHFSIERVPAHAGDASVTLREKSTFVVPR
jgi:hypothetical protein